MTPSDFRDQVETTFDVAFVAQRGQLHVLGFDTLPSYLRLAIVGHRAELLSFLEKGENEPFVIERCQAELVQLGFMQLETGVWAFPDGDEAGDRILSGLLDPDEAAREATAQKARAVAEAHAFGVPFLPALQDVEDLRQVAPGEWRWSLRRGPHRYRDPFPKVTRIY